MPAPRVEVNVRGELLPDLDTPVLHSVGLPHSAGISFRSTEIAPLIVVRHSRAMGGPERRNGGSSMAQKPTSRIASGSSIDDAPPPPRVTLPSDLPGSLKYLDDSQLQRLLEAVTVEIDRRKQGAPKEQTATAATAGTPGQSAAIRNKKVREIDEIPEGRANLIRASFRAGIKPAAIARTFRLSQSLVNSVLSSAEKARR